MIEAVSSELLQSVRSFLRNLAETGRPLPDRIVPTVEGGVALEWFGPTTYLEMEIERPYCAEVMEVSDGSRTEHYEVCWE